MVYRTRKYNHTFWISERSPIVTSQQTTFDISSQKKFTRNAKIAKLLHLRCLCSRVRHDTCEQHRAQGFLFFRYGGHRTLGTRFVTNEFHWSKQGERSFTKTLTFKTSVSVKSFRILFAWEYEIFFKPIPSYLASLWHWALEQLSNCQFSLYLYCYLFTCLFFTCISTCRLTLRL